MQTIITNWLLRHVASQEAKERLDAVTAARNAVARAKAGAK